MGSGVRIRGRGAARLAGRGPDADRPGVDATGLAGAVAPGDGRRRGAVRVARLLPVSLPALRGAAGEDPVPGRPREVRAEGAIFARGGAALAAGVRAPL